MKFALVVGHEQTAPGAKGVDPLNCYEYEYNKELAAMISCDLNDLQIDSEIFFRDKIGIHGVYSYVNRYSPAGVIELHFNASVMSTARGTETLFVPRVLGSKLLARCIQNSMVKALNRPQMLDRGLVTPDVTDRGYTNLTQAQCPCVLIEPFFGDNSQDAQLGKNLKSELALGIAQGIQRFLMGMR